MVRATGRRARCSAQRAGSTSRLRCRPWVAKVRIAQQDPLALLGKKDGEVPAQKAFALRPPSGLVTSTERGGAPFRDNIREVRSERSDSTNRERGLSNAGSGDFLAQSVLAGEDSLFLLIRQHTDRRRTQLARYLSQILNPGVGHIAQQARREPRRSTPAAIDPNR